MKPSRRSDLIRMELVGVVVDAIVALACVGLLVAIVALGGFVLLTSVETFVCADSSEQWRQLNDCQRIAPFG